jgi:peptide/nickel transport system substrate-binding protein
MKRRNWFSRLACVVAFPVFVAAGAHALSADKVIRIAPHSNLTILDPIWTTAYITRNHGYMIYDTLFGTDAKGKVQPQMVDRWELSKDRKTWTFTLRDGLEFHDGKPVTSEDAIASLTRWGKRDTMGEKLLSFGGQHGSRQRTYLADQAQGTLRPSAGISGQARLKCSLHHAAARG